MGNKFGRKFNLGLQTNESTREALMEFLKISMPFTVQFSITRNLMSSLNTATFTIYNLSKKNRNLIFKDRFTPIYKRVYFEAGYSNLSLCFQGSIFSAFSERRGPDIVTIIESKDGGYDTNKASLSRTFNKGVTRKDINEAAIDSFEVLKKGNMAGVEDYTTQRATVIDSNSIQVLKKNSSGLFIDLETVNILKDNQVFRGEVPLISTETGLLGTPKRQDSYITVDSMFEPAINIGQAVEVRSQVQKQFNGQYKVIGINHNGVISGAISGEARTKLSLLLPDQLTGKFEEV